MHKLITTPRDKRIENWDNIKTIGLIFTVGSSEQWNLIHRFITAQESRGKEVYLIGYQGKNIEINYIFSHTRTTICHEKDDFNFFGIPKEGVTDPFTNRHFDIVIDSTSQPDFFGKYVTSLCSADLKVGYTNNAADYDEGNMEMYDMAIQGKEQMDFKDYIEQTVKYLSMIHKE